MTLNRYSISVISASTKETETDHLSEQATSVLLGNINVEEL